MNATVARIVEIMFQDTLMTEEAQAMKDEVMINCQERFADLVARGFSEDDAIAAVVNSLSGMEDVIANYPRKNDEKPCENEAEIDPEQDLVFDPAQVNNVTLYLSSEDVTIAPSQDGMIHLQYNLKECPDLSAVLYGDKLQVENKTEEEKDTGKTEWSFQWNSFGDLVDSIKKLLKQAPVRFNCGGGPVTVSLPAAKVFDAEIHTVSGDVELSGVQLCSLVAETISGDVNASVPRTCVPSVIRAKTSSGDVEISSAAAQLQIHTISGDVSYSGACPDVNVQTVSGDAEIGGCVQKLFLKTVSGDIDLHVQDSQLREVSCNTVSGDLAVHLPESLHGMVGVSIQTTSGDVHNRFGECTGVPAAQVSMRSVSGDVTVR